MTKRVLMIAYLFPPIANSGTQRPLKFAKYLRDFGWEPIVLTADRPPNDRVDKRLLDDIPAGVRVLRAPMLNDRVGDLLGRLAPAGPARTRIAAGVSWRLREWWRRPDLYALWRPMARRAALRAYREIGFDAILATGFPWTSLLIGRDVSRATGRGLVADFRDPWAGDELFKPGPQSRANDIAGERSVVRQASAVISVSDTMTRSMIAAHADADTSKFVTIPNGYDPEDLAAADPPSHKRFRVVYTGVWKEGYAGAGALYDVIARLKQSAPHLLTNLDVIAAGFAPGPAQSRGLAQHITEVGVLSHESALSLMCSADLLYLQNGIGSRQRWCLPGKIFEYLATGRPILAVTDPTGEAGSLIRRIGGGVAVSPDEPERLEQIITDALVRGALNVPRQDREALAAFERPALTRRLAAVLDSVTQPAFAQGLEGHRTRQPAVLR